MGNPRTAQRARAEHCAAADKAGQLQRIPRGGASIRVAQRRSMALAVTTYSMDDRTRMYMDWATPGENIANIRLITL